ncbi:DNA polymerase III subunit beta [Streptococcus equinus]|uniref:helix-turn-helix domain-containing protein n=1 Tax=Streptococcus equinus TaxID=1335 RepID=UPI000F708F8F|nr:helix-turn-helix transcriptional regulator [Streptococcus equinus]VEE23843.1 DNA polymerase III subunit beta [Streptococcus equinus]
MENRLKELRKAKGLTLDELSKGLKEKFEVSLSTGQLSSYENGRRSPRAENTWKTIADYFNVSISYLLGYSDIKEPYYGDEILFDDGQGGYTSLSGERENELSELYFERLEEEFVKFLKRYDFVISDNEIKAVLNHISNLNINTYKSDEYNRLVDLVMEEKIDLKKIGYSKLGDNFHYWKAFDDFKKSLGYDTNHIL